MSENDRPSLTAAPIQIRTGNKGRLFINFPYTQEWVDKIKRIEGRRRHPQLKYWTVPHTDRVLDHLLKVFAGEPVKVDSALRSVKPLNDGKPSSAPPTKVIDQLREALRSRHYGGRTEQAYDHWLKRFIGFHRMRDPKEMAEGEINAFLAHHFFLVS